MKKFILGMILLSSIFITNIVAEAATNAEQLTIKELDYLYNTLNFTEEKIEFVPLDALQELVKNKAVRVSSVDEILEVDESPESIYGLTPLGEIPKSELRLTADAYKFATSDLSGYNKFYSYANFQWLKHPTFNLVDKIAIGLPVSLGVYYPTSNGSITGFYSRTGIYNMSTGKSTVLEQAYSPAPGNFQIGSGVASQHDLRLTLNSDQVNEGFVSQNFYIKNNISGNSNIHFEYGHKRVSGSVGLSFGSGVGISITPGLTTDILSFVDSFDY